MRVPIGLFECQSNIGSGIHFFIIKILYFKLLIDSKSIRLNPYLSANTDKVPRVILLCFVFLRKYCNVNVIKSQ